MKALHCVSMGALAALAGCTSAPPMEALGCGTPADANATADVTLTAHDTVITPRDGTSFVAWTYDGDVPGPAIRLTLGETRRIKLVNQGPRPLGLHFHGVGHGQADDASSDDTGMVNPGCAHVYTITAREPGVWAYHSHRDPRREIAYGLHGAVIVPAAGETVADHEFVVLLGQLGLEGAAEGGGKVDEEEGAAQAPFFAMTINGRPDGHAEVIELKGNTYVAASGDAVAEARVGQRVRFRVLNVAPDDAHTFHLHGHRWCDRGGAMGGDGTCPASTLPTDNVDLLPAQGTSLEFVEDNPGQWMLHCHVLDHVNDGMFAFYRVSE